MQTAELKIEGMHCQKCVSIIEDALGRVPGVMSASVDLESGRAAVLHEGADESTLAEAVTASGYQASIINS